MKKHDISQSLVYSVYKYWLLPLFFLPIRLIATFVPKEKNLYIFGSWKGKDFIDNAKYFYNYLKKKNLDKRLVVIIKNRKKYYQLLKKGYEVYLAYSLRGLLITARASVCFITHAVEDDLNVCTLTRGTKIIQLWHGAPIKRLKRASATINNKLLKLLLIFIYKVSHYCFPEVGLVSTISSFFRKDLADFLGVENNKVKVLGQPRNDAFFKKKKKKIFGKYEGLKKYILFAPTHRGNKGNLKFFTDKFLLKLNKYLNQNNFLFVIKVHPWSSKKKQLYKNYSNIINASFLKNVDIQDMLCKTDILIADYSSIIFDFALMDKPIIFYPFDYDDYSIEVGFFLDYYQDLPGPFANNENRLFDLVKKTNVWFNDKKYKNKYKKFKDKFNYYQDGNSSRRLYEYLLTIL